MKKNDSIWSERPKGHLTLASFGLTKGERFYVAARIFEGRFLSIIAL